MSARFKKTGLSVGIFALCLVLVIILFNNMRVSVPSYGCKGYIDYADDAAEMELNAGVILENDSLALSIDESYRLQLKDKATGKIWYAGLNDDTAKKFSISDDTAFSLCSLEYLSEENTVDTYNSYTHAVCKNQAKLYKNSDGSIKITFIFGERRSDNIVPKALTKKRFENDILPKLSEDQQDFLKRRYTLFSVDTMTEADDPQKKVEEFANLKNTDLYILADANGKVVNEKTKKAFDEIGYTREDYIKDNKLTGYTGDEQECTFKISMNFALDGNDLLLSIPSKELDFYAETPLLTVTPVQFMTSSCSGDGKILLPSGSGSYIDFSVSDKIGSYSKCFYGSDFTQKYDSYPTEMLEHEESIISMPVYFFHDGSNAIMTVIESGAASAVMNIDRNGSSVYAYPKFNIIQNGYSYLTEKKKSIVCGSEALNEDIVIRYRCFSQNDTFYVQDALMYRNYLNKNGKIEKKTVSADPLYLLETTGSVRYNNKIKYLTSMEDSYEMAKKLNEEGVKRISLKMTGVNKRGGLSQIPGRYVLDKRSGNKAVFAKIQSYINELDGKAYFQMNHLYYYDGSAFDGWSSKKLSAKMPDKSWAVQGAYDLIEGTFCDDNDSIRIMSPKTYIDTVKSYLNSGCKNIGVGNLASNINSDYNNLSYYDRSRALNEVVKAFEEYKKSDCYIAAIKANEYAFKYTDLIEALDVSGDNNIIFDGSVPFCQIVLHGYVEYTGKAVNSQADWDYSVLKAIETGSGIHFVLNKNIDSTIFNTDSDSLYFTDYNYAFEKSLKSYKYINAALSGLSECTIDGHCISDRVTVTDYSNGTRIYVNYGSDDCSIDGIIVPAKGYYRLDP